MRVQLKPVQLELVQLELLASTRDGAARAVLLAQFELAQAVLASEQQAAQDLINYLTSEAAQAKFVEDTHEYSLIPGAKAPASLPELKSIGSPKVDLASLEKVQATQDLLTKVGLL